MQAINLDTVRTNNGISIYEVLKSIINESNFTDEDLEYEIPIKKKNPFFYANRYREYSK